MGTAKRVAIFAEDAPRIPIGWRCRECGSLHAGSVEEVLKAVVLDDPPDCTTLTAPPGTVGTIGMVDPDGAEG